MQPLCVKRRAFEGEVYLADRNAGVEVVRNAGDLIGANSKVSYRRKNREGGIGRLPL